MGKREIAIAAFAGLLLGLLAFLWFSPGGLRSAPGLTLTTLDGHALPLAERQGRPLLVTFWATSCPGCVKEIPHLADLYRELAPQGLELVGVAMEYDPPDQVRAMVAEKAIPYPIVLDTEGRVAEAFGGVRLTPTHFLIDPEGRIVQQKLGELEMGPLRERLVAMLKGSV